MANYKDLWIVLITTQQPLTDLDALGEDCLGKLEHVTTDKGYLRAVVNKANTVISYS